MTQDTTTTSGAAIQRYKIGYHADEWGQRSSTPSGIPDASGSWVRYADHVTALAAGQATAAQAVVPAEWPTNEMIDTGRKAAASQGRLLGSGQSLWHVFRAMLAAAPAQPAAEPSRFGSPELQAMIIARCVEKDQADSVQEDAALWHWLAEYLVGARTDLDDEIVASETVNDLIQLVKAAIKQGEKQ